MDASKPTQPELPLFQAPTVHIPAIRLLQPDGSILFKPGKPVIVEPEMKLSEAAVLLGMARRTLETHCAMGWFKTAHKPGGRRNSLWRLARSEVLSRITQVVD
jgi:hypothetical protein